MFDAYRVLPHRDVLVIDRHADKYEHKPCGMPLTEVDVIEANWCIHCAVTINKAAQKRAQAERHAA